MKRRREGGDQRWFEERSRAPRSCPHATPQDQAATIILMRKRLPHVGPKTVRAKLMAATPDVAGPAPSTISSMLKAARLVAARRCRRRPLDRGQVVAGSDVANGEWALDFKGHLGTRDGTPGDPLTVSDTASRYHIGGRIAEPA